MNARISFCFVAVALAMATVTAAASCRPARGVAAAGDGATYVVGIEGMSCQNNCAPKVKSALESIDGVTEAEVSFADKRAIVKMAAGRELTRGACDESLGNSGYFVSSLVPASDEPAAEDH